MAGPSVAKNWSKIKNQVLHAQKNSKFTLKEVCIIGVSKLQNEDVIEEGLRSGVCHLGENYVQELVKKMDTFANQKVVWHMIGPLQSNKAKLVVGRVEMIHTLDRESLAQTISNLALQKNIKQEVFIQVNIANEDSKSGISVKEVAGFAKKIKGLEGLDIVGLMTMPPFVSNAENSRPYFSKLREIRDELNANIFLDKKLEYLSMGTSQDFEVAIDEGATHIRVGSTLFGERTK